MLIALTHLISSRKNCLWRSLTTSLQLRWNGNWIQFFKLSPICPRTPTEFEKGVVFLTDFSPFFNKSTNAANLSHFVNLSRRKSCPIFHFYSQKSNLTGLIDKMCLNLDRKRSIFGFAMILCFMPTHSQYQFANDSEFFSHITLILIKLIKTSFMRPTYLSWMSN